MGAMAAHAARRPDEAGRLITVANNDCIRAFAKSWNRLAAAQPVQQVCRVV